MKKKLIIIAIVVLACAFGYAQNYYTLYVQNIPDETQYDYCGNEYDGVIVLGRPECQSQNQWKVNGEWTYEDYITLNKEGGFFDIIHIDCIDGRRFYIKFDSEITNPFPAPYVWKRKGDAIELYAPGNVEWSNGSHDNTIYVIEEGTYAVTITNACGSETFPIQVRDNVELYRATIDLESNLNKTTWRVTPEQAEYINEVKIYRDGMFVGTASYENGYFLDAIGSDNAARNYKIVGISIEGEDCPITSYEKGTIHTTYYQDVNNNLNMTWNIPYVQQGAQGTLTYFQICKYDPNTGEITVVDQVNAAITDYTCGVNQFEGGYAVIAAVFNDGKGVEELSFSNLTTDILGIEEDGPSTGSGTFTVYPNPAKDRVTIEGTGKAIITNALGQTILTKEIDGKATIELPQGLYFVKLGGATQKVVVE